MQLRTEKIRRLTLFSRHPVLDQVAEDIARGVDPEQLPDMDINVYVGIHKRYGRAMWRPGFKIGIQTEHYFDAEGRKLWRCGKRWRLLKDLLIYDRILDLSPANKVNYTWLPKFLLKRIVFGPFIFPSNPIDFFPASNSRLAFFGCINERRRDILTSLPADSIHILPDESFGSILSETIRQYNAVLNIHYNDGKFSEFPRLLFAYLEGKVVVSEELGAELKAGIHYVKLNEYDRCQDLQPIFCAFRDEFAARYRFTDFLRNITETNLRTMPRTDVACKTSVKISAR